MRTKLLCAGLLLLALPASAGRGPQWKAEMDFYKSMKLPPMDSMAIGAVNVRVGMFLDRLTLLSGEGHTGKKIAGGVMAVGLGLLGGSGSTAAREPLEEHLTAEDAKKIGDEVAESIEKHLAPAGVKVVSGEQVTGIDAYRGLKDNLMASEKEAFTEKGGRFSREMFYGYWMQPAGSYAYRGSRSGFAQKMGFGSASGMWGDKDFSPVIRGATSTQALATADVFLVNDRKTLHVHELRIKVFSAMRAGGTDNIVLNYNLNDADEVAVPVSGSHKDNYALWQALRPQFEAKLDEVAVMIAKATH